MRHSLTCFASLAFLVWCITGCGGVAKGGGTEGNAGSGGGLSCQYGGTIYADGVTFPSDDGCNSCNCAQGGVACTHRACVDTCDYGGKSYPVGLSFPALDGCNSCSCSGAGQVACTQRACAVPCVYGSYSYMPGSSFPATDGCNTCTCSADGQVDCTNIGCGGCDAIASQYAAALELAEACDPKLVGQCTARISNDLICGCESFVNPDNRAAITNAQALQGKYVGLMCSSMIQCPRCLPPLGARCSPSGRCEPIGDSGTACKVNGVVYLSGTGGIPDPTSCNQCICADGQLHCGEIDCFVSCPPNTIWDGQCVECGPTDACLVVEYGCLPTCSDACNNGGVCLGGTCKKVCG